MKKLSHSAGYLKLAARSLAIGTLGLASITFTTTAKAHPWVGFLSWEALGVGGLAVGGPAGAAAGVIVGGVVGSICTLLDPPDTFNAGLRANPGLINYTLPADPSFSSSLQGAAQKTVDTASVLIQQYKGLKDTEDRLAGAQLLGNAGYIANQTLWLKQYQADAASTSKQLTTDVQSYLSLLSAQHPEIANATLSASQWQSAVDDAKNGIFPALTTALYQHYQIDSAYLPILSATLSSATANDIKAFETTTYSQMLSSSAQTCETCIPPVPEPSSAWLLIAGAGVLGMVRRIS